MPTESTGSPRCKYPSDAPVDVAKLFVAFERRVAFLGVYLPRVSQFQELAIHRTQAWSSDPRAVILIEGDQHAFWHNTPRQWISTLADELDFLAVPSVPASVQENVS